MKKAKRKESSPRLRKILLSPQFCITVLVLMSLLALICLAKVILGFMPVKHFKVEGDTHYDISEIISASGIRSGDKLYRIDEKKAVQKLVKDCPYIKTTKIKQKFPNTVCFVVQEQEPGWYIQVGKDFYGLDYDMKVLLETYIEDDFIDRGLTKLTLPELEEVIVGELPRFASGDEHLIEETLKIIDAFRTHEMKGILTGLDISNRFEIKLEIDNSYDVYFGDMTSFDVKMKALTEVLKKSSVEYGYGGGTITWDESYGTFALKGVFPDPSETEGENSSENATESDIID
jgi:hypothetical protein